MRWRYSVTAALTLAYSAVNPYTFAEPTSPHIVSADEDRPIDFDGALQRLRVAGNARPTGCWWRGLAAGLPRSREDQTFADWVQREQLPVILVVGVKLGCINHAMLTAQAVAQAGLRLAGGSPMTW